MLENKGGYYPVHLYIEEGRWGHISVWPISGIKEMLPDHGGGNLFVGTAIVVDFLNIFLLYLLKTYRLTEYIVLFFYKLSNKGVVIC